MEQRHVVSKRPDVRQVQQLQIWAIRLETEGKIENKNGTGGIQGKTHSYGRDDLAEPGDFIVSQYEVRQAAVHGLAQIDKGLRVNGRSGLENYKKSIKLA